MHSVIETATFLRGAEDAGMTDDERHELVVFLSLNPDAGDVIAGTGGARKLRIPFKGKGKAKGARVVTFYSGTDIPVFLLDVYSKGDRINLSQAERNALKRVLGEIAGEYGARQREKTRKIGSAS